MTFAEKAPLDRDSAGMSISSYIRWRLFNPDQRLRGKFPVKDHQAISRLMALLGQSRIANNLNQLANSANAGNLLLDEDTTRDIHQAAADIADMRRLLLAALSLDAS